MDTGRSYRWLRFGDIKGQAESTITAAQDQAVSTTTLRETILNKKLKASVDHVRIRRNY